MSPRSLSFTLSLFFFFLFSSPLLVHSQGENPDPGVACLVQFSCSGCLAVTGCGWCNLNNAEISSGFCLTTALLTDQCSTGFTPINAGTQCPAQANVIGNNNGNNPPVNPITVNPETGQIIVNGQPFGTTNTNTGAVEPSRSKVYAGVALLIITCFIAVAAMVIMTVGYNRYQAAVNSHVRHQQGHQLNSLAGKCAVGFLEICAFTLLLAGLATNIWSRQRSDFGGHTEFGVVSATSFGVESKYADYCSGGSGLFRTQCNTLRAGGALTLVFGLLGLLLTTAVIGLLIYYLYKGQKTGGATSQLQYFHVVFLQSLACVCIFAAVLCWSFGGHLELTALSGVPTVDLAASWGLFLATFVLSVGLVILHIWVYTLGDYQHTPIDGQHIGTNAAGQNKEFPQVDGGYAQSQQPPVVNAPYGAPYAPANAV
jgi:hypothetical protein